MPASIHEHPEEWLATALADGLAPEERRALDEHLGACEHCRELQADLAALDAELLRDFPMAVGPAPGFETRLVAGFRRRRGGGRMEKLRALLGWLVRQRGVQFAGVAATLAGLVWIGQTLTGDRPRATFVANDARIIDGAIDQSAIENNMRGDASVSASDLKGFFKPSSRASNHEEPVNPPVTASHDVKVLTPNVINQPVFSTKRGAQITDYDGFINYGSPIQTTTTNAVAISENKPTGALSVGAGYSSVDSLTGANTYSGGVSLAPGTPSASAGTIASTSGTLTMNGGAVATPSTSTININGMPPLTLLDGRTLSDSKARLPTDTSTVTTRAVGGEVDFTGGKASAPLAVTGTAYGFTEKGNVPDTRQPSPAPTPQPSAALAAADVPAAAPSAPPATDVRKLIRNASAELEVAAFDPAVEAITAAAARHGGFLDTRDSERGGNGKISGTVVVKILPDNLDRFLAGLRPLGDLKNQSVQTEDVTKDYFDTDARMRNSRRMEDRLLKMLGEVKGKMSEVLQVEKEIARVRADIETMQGQLKLYDAQVRYATVTLEISERDLHQPAAFLLHETATLSLLAADVEKTAAEARRIADTAHVQILRSDVSRDRSERVRATLSLIIAPETSAEVISQIKALGRVENFHVQDERTAQNGVTSDAAGTDAAKVERAPVTLDLTINHDEQISRQITFTLVAADAEAAYEKARAAAQAAGGEIVNSNLARTQDRHASATLGVRVPAAAQAALITNLQSLGRAGELETRRVASGPETPSEAAGPVLIQLSVTDTEPVVQRTTARVWTDEVERRADEIKREAAASHAEVEASDFSSGSDGAQHAELRFRLPMSAYPGFIERVRALGVVKDFTIERRDRPEKAGEKTEAGAPVVVALTLYSEGRIVGESSGLGATLRGTFGQGAGALMWSVRMIGVALAFLAPWTVLAVLAALAIRWSRRRKQARSAKEEAS